MMCEYVGWHVRNMEIGFVIPMNIQFFLNLAKYLDSAHTARLWGHRILSIQTILLLNQSDYERVNQSNVCS